MNVVTIKLPNALLIAEVLLQTIVYLLKKMFIIINLAYEIPTYFPIFYNTCLF